ncbi:MAG: LTA synthase family protein, partial [Bacteroidales bacterium]|nr:LTA synthase family protein [Bacteroidales bacterium]
DHTGEGTVAVPDNRYMSYQIPVFFYHPLANAKETKHIIQQVDIMPSIFSYLKIDKPLFSFGNTVFDTTYIPFAVNYLSGIYQFITDDFVLQFDGEKTIALFNIQTDVAMQDNLKDVMPDKVALYEQKLKAFIQSYTTRMNRNKLFIENK